MNNRDFNSKAVFNIIIFVLFLGTAMYLGNLFLSFVLKMPIDEVPAIAKVIVHGITLGLIFNFVRKFFGRGF